MSEAVKKNDAFDIKSVPNHKKRENERKSKFLDKDKNEDYFDKAFDEIENSQTKLHVLNEPKNKLNRKVVADEMQFLNSANHSQMTDINTHRIKAEGSMKSPFKNLDKKVHWVPNKAIKICSNCSKKFSVFKRKHHCRICGKIYCSDCVKPIQIPSVKQVLFNRRFKICCKCQQDAKRYQQNLEEQKALDTLNDAKLVDAQQKAMEKSFEEAMNFDVEDRSKPLYNISIANINFNIGVEMRKISSSMGEGHGKFDQS